MTAKQRRAMGIDDDMPILDDSDVIVLEDEIYEDWDEEE